MSEQQTHDSHWQSTDDDKPSKFRVGSCFGVHLAFAEQSQVGAYETCNYFQDVSPEIENHGNEGTELNYGNERGPLIRMERINEVHPLTCESEVCGTADWDEFSQALNKPEQYSLQKRH